MQQQTTNDNANGGSGTYQQALRDQEGWQRQNLSAWADDLERRANEQTQFGEQLAQIKAKLRSQPDNAAAILTEALSTHPTNTALLHLCHDQAVALLDANDPNGAQCLAEIGLGYGNDQQLNPKLEGLCAVAILQNPATNQAEVVTTANQLAKLLPLAPELKRRAVAVLELRLAREVASGTPTVEPLASALGLLSPETKATTLEQIRRRFRELRVESRALSLEQVQTLIAARDQNKLTEANKYLTAIEAEAEAAQEPGDRISSQVQDLRAQIASQQKALDREVADKEKRLEQEKAKEKERLERDEKTRQQCEDLLIKARRYVEVAKELVGPVSPVAARQALDLCAMIGHLDPGYPGYKELILEAKPLSGPRPRIVWPTVLGLVLSVVTLVSIILTFSLLNLRIAAISSSGPTTVALASSESATVEPASSVFATVAPTPPVPAMATPASSVPATVAPTPTDRPTLIPSPTVPPATPAPQESDQLTIINLPTTLFDLPQTISGTASISTPLHIQVMQDSRSVEEGEIMVNENGTWQWKPKPENPPLQPGTYTLQLSSSQATPKLVSKPVSFTISPVLVKVRVKIDGILHPLMLSPEDSPTETQNVTTTTLQVGDELEVLGFFSRVTNGTPFNFILVRQPAQRLQSWYRARWTNGDADAIKTQVPLIETP